MGRLIATTAVLLALAAPPATAASYRYPGRYLTNAAGVSVFASFLGAIKLSAACPRHPLPLPKAALKASATAVARAMPALYRQDRQAGHPRVDARGALGKSVRANSSSALSAYRTLCGPTVWSRSAFVSVRLPHVRFSASLATPSFEVARTPLGWIIWAEVH